MAQAVFICVRSNDLRPEDVSNLGALAVTAREAGLTPTLVVVDLEDTDKAPESVPDVFDSAIRVAAPNGAGDGAGMIDALLASLLEERSPALVVATTTLASRNWGPRLAGRLSAGFAGAVDRLTNDGGLFVSEPVMGAMLHKKVKIDRPFVALYAGEDLASPSATTELPAATDPQLASTGPRLTKRVALPDTGGLPLKGAARIVSGGLGVGSAENWARIEEFASRVSAAVGASRAAVDMGWVPSSRQVGFSGQKVSPDVYVAIGISGAVHHLAGITGARKVVAINKDPEAPIFQIAEVAIIGDYQAVLEAAHRKLDQA